jgi:hypothetical protein
MRTVEPRSPGESIAAGAGGTDASSSAGGGATPGPAVEGDDLITGAFDQTNGVVPGLDGESDGTLDGENLPAAFRTGVMRPARLWNPHPHPSAFDAVAEEEEQPADTGRHRRRGHRS